ncbi:hypothetical protein TGRUB_431570 [Toxoplasma gondii RUB]|uniref:Uncharacterized protein n=1 Tax=Toxoplasma gondii RUB TaxID=935652 RepID=A0A086LWR4_TOXGO|nr:hypothetical protein TGRUB_431570 [Toxoplasma gondii RUB]
MLTLLFWTDLLRRIFHEYNSCQDCLVLSACFESKVQCRDSNFSPIVSQVCTEVEVNGVDLRISLSFQPVKATSNRRDNLSGLLEKCRATTCGCVVHDGSQRVADKAPLFLLDDSVLRGDLFVFVGESPVRNWGVRLLPGLRGSTETQSAVRLR